MTDLLERPELAVGDRRNMACSGTTVVAGRGVGVVVASLVFVAVEIEKWMVRRGWIYGVPSAGRNATAV